MSARPIRAIARRADTVNPGPGDRSLDEPRRGPPRHRRHAAISSFATASSAHPDKLMKLAHPKFIEYPQQTFVSSMATGGFELEKLPYISPLGSSSCDHLVVARGSFTDRDEACRIR